MNHDELNGKRVIRVLDGNRGFTRACRACVFDDRDNGCPIRSEEELAIFGVDCLGRDHQGVQTRLRAHYMEAACSQS